MQDLAQNENVGAFFKRQEKNAVKGTTIKFFSFFYDLSLELLLQVLFAI